MQDRIRSCRARCIKMSKASASCPRARLLRAWFTSKQSDDFAGGSTQIPDIAWRVSNDARTCNYANGWGLRGWIARVTAFRVEANGLFERPARTIVFLCLPLSHECEGPCEDLKSDFESTMFSPFLDRDAAFKWYTVESYFMLYMCCLEPMLNLLQFKYEMWLRDYYCY